MDRTALHRLGRALIVIGAAALMTACADENSSGRDRGAASQSLLAPSAGGTLDDAFAAGGDHGHDNRGPDLTGCEELRAPVGSRLVFSAYAKGVQVYRWSGTAWTFVAPAAALFTERNGKGVAAIHYAGPTWESISGSKVVGTVQKRCTPNANAIPWLSLSGVSSDGPGIFDQVVFIQRVNTAGGNAPSTPGGVVGQAANVPYTAEYFFYRAQ